IYKTNHYVMKKNSFKVFVKRNLSAVIVAALLSVNTNAAEITADKTLYEAVATVKYLGSDSNSYLFNVVYINESGEKFSLRITDEAGNTLFTGIYTDKKFDKRFRLSKEDVNGRLNFAIKNFKDNSVQTFQVITTSQLVEDIVIKRVNK
ncbi:MAG: hypothetical protein ABUT20_51130, partial [Bacteroidota bacterium]